MFTHTRLASVAALVLCYGCTDDLPTGSPATRSYSTTANPTTEVVFGPRVFTRDNGKPVTETVDVVIPDLAYYQQLTLHIDNGDADASRRVSSARVTLGSTSFGPADFSQNVTQLSKPVSLSGPAQLRVELASKPGSRLTIRIEGVLRPGTARIGSQGGTVVSDDGRLVLVVPAGALTSSQLLRISSTSQTPPPVFAGDIVGTTLALEPHGLTFRIPAQATLTLPAGFGTADIAVAYWSEDGRSVKTITANTSSNSQLTFNLNGFSYLTTIAATTDWTLANMRWVIPVVRWYVVPGASPYLTQAAIRQALTEWQVETGQLAFEQTFVRSNAQIVFDELDTSFPANLFFADAYGVTSMNFTATVFESEIESDDVATIGINSALITADAQTRGLPAADLSYVVIRHEIGHAIGINHTRMRPPGDHAIMEEAAYFVRTGLHEWDIAAVRAHYGSPQPQLACALPVTNPPGQLLPRGGNFHRESSIHAIAPFHAGIPADAVAVVFVWIGPGGFTYTTPPQMRLPGDYAESGYTPGHGMPSGNSADARGGWFILGCWQNAAGKNLVVDVTTINFF